MDKVKALTHEERAQISVLNQNGFSNRKIAKQIDRSEGVIRNFLKNPRKYGQRKSPKGNKKLSALDIGRIKHEATKNHLNSQQIKDKLNLPVTKQHIARLLRNDPIIKWKKPLCKPRLAKRHLEARLKWAREHMAFKEEWNSVIFSDEKKFNLDGPDCFSHYWHKLNSTDDPRTKRNFGGGTVMVWGAFSSKGKLTLCFPSSRMNSDEYLEMLESVFVPYSEENFENNFLFQQDNAAIHVSKKCREWFATGGITLMEWPACSPDCNPMENLWAILARKVYRNGRQFNTIQELRGTIASCWNEIDDQVLHNLIQSMPNRVFEVIKQNGKHIKY